MRMFFLHLKSNLSLRIELDWFEVNTSSVNKRFDKNNLNICQFFFFLNFWRTHILFVGPLIPLFRTSGDICPGFQSQGGLTCMLSYLRAIPQIHLWCNTCWPLDGQHGSRATLTYILAAVRPIHKHWWYRGRNCDSNLWPGPGLEPTTYRAAAQRT